MPNLMDDTHKVKHFPIPDFQKLFKAGVVQSHQLARIDLLGPRAARDADVVLHFLYLGEPVENVAKLRHPRHLSPQVGLHNSLGDFVAEPLLECVLVQLDQFLKESCLHFGASDVHELKSKQRARAFLVGPLTDFALFGDAHFDLPLAFHLGFQCRKQN